MNEITSVLGFDLDTILLDSEGNEVGKGYTTILPEETDELPIFLKIMIRDTSNFDHYDYGLLEKIKAVRRINS